VDTVPSDMSSVARYNEEESIQVQAKTIHILISSSRDLSDLAVINMYLSIRVLRVHANSLPIQNFLIFIWS
jgi:hypothetical protein